MTVSLNLNWERAGGIAVFATLLMIAPAASAADSECDVDSDCGKGFTCEEFQPACPDIYGYECPTETFRLCVLAECETEDDCAEGMQCLPSSYWECDAETDSCGRVDGLTCAPPWAGECATDEDCGEGFRCIDEEQCGCQGSSGSSGSSDGRDLVDDGRAPPDLEPECSCEPTGRRICELQALPCESDATCPEGWQCAPDPSSPVCGGTTSNEPAVRDPDAADTDARDVAESDARVATDPCPSEPPTVCLPPSYRSRDGGDFGFGGELGVGSDSVGESDPRGTGSDDGASTTAESSSDAAEPKSGCQLGGDLGTASTGFAWLTLALVALRRRRARRTH